MTGIFDEMLDEIPSDGEVVAAIRSLDGEVTAARLVQLLSQRFPEAQVQRAIQRALGRGKIRYDARLELVEARELVF